MSSAQRDNGLWLVVGVVVVTVLALVVGGAVALFAEGDRLALMGALFAFAVTILGPLVGVLLQLGKVYDTVNGKTELRVQTERQQAYALGFNAGREQQQKQQQARQ